MYKKVHIIPLKRLAHLLYTACSGLKNTAKPHIKTKGSRCRHDTESMAQCINATMLRDYGQL